MKKNKKQVANNDSEIKVSLKRAKKAYKIITTVLLIAVCLFLTFIAVLIFYQRLNDRDPKVFGYYFYTVLTDSMEPTLQAGDAFLAKDADISSLKEGDIVTFVAQSGSLKGHNVTHRIVSIYEENGITYVITKGDNPNVGYDKPIEVKYIKSVLVKKLPFISKLLNFVKKPVGFFTLIFLPLLASAVLIIIGYFKEKYKTELKSKTDGTGKDDKGNYDL